MLEISVITTDQAFIDDLNAAGIEGVRAEYRPTMAFDSTEHILQIVVTAAASAGLKFVASWIAERLKRDPTKQMTINNVTINNAENVVVIVNNYIDTQDKKKG